MKWVLLTFLTLLALVGSEEQERLGLNSFRAQDVLAESGEAIYIPSVFADWGEQVTASVGEVSFPVFVVEFQDVKYKTSKVSQEELARWIFDTNADSVAGYYETASHGRMELTGDVYEYTAKGNMADYENNAALEGLLMEILEFYNEEIDFSRYDRNGDSVLDAVAVSVPSGNNAAFWWAGTHKWYENWEYSVDGLYLMNYIISDEQPYENSRTYYVGTLRHELGHCLGLPDYYKYSYTGTDYEGLHGLAGKELMDDSEGDFCQFSKLQLGWLTKDQVQIMPWYAERATFWLPSAAEGGCILIFPRGQKPDLQGEYFLVEYNTPEGNQEGVIGQGGVRIFHAEAEVFTEDGYYYAYKYNNFSPFYDDSNNGRRVLKLVNDGKGFYREGDIVTFENTGAEEGNFGWYTEDGNVSDCGFSVEIGQLDEENGCMEITIAWDK